MTKSTTTSQNWITTENLMEAGSKIVNTLIENGYNKSDAKEIALTLIQCLPEALRAA